MGETWSQPEENMEDVRIPGFKARKPEDDELSLDELDHLLKNHRDRIRTDDDFPTPTDS